VQTWLGVPGTNAFASSMWWSFLCPSNGVIMGGHLGTPRLDEPTASDERDRGQKGQLLPVTVCLPASDMRPSREIQTANDHLPRSASAPLERATNLPPFHNITQASSCQINAPVD